MEKVALLAFLDELVKISEAGEVEKDAGAGKFLRRLIGGAAEEAVEAAPRATRKVQKFRSPFIKPKAGAEAAEAAASAAPLEPELAKLVPGPIHHRAAAPMYGRTPATDKLPGLLPHELAPKMTLPKNMTLAGGAQNRRAFEDLARTPEGRRAIEAIESHHLVSSGKIPKENALQLMDWGRQSGETMAGSILRQTGGRAPAASGVRLKGTAAATPSAKVAVASVSYDEFILGLPMDVIAFFDARRVAAAA